MRSIAAFLAIFLAIAKAVEGIKLSEWFGLRIPNEPRDLQAPGVFNLCADAFAGPNNHLLALLAANGHVLAKWVPAGDQPFTATVDLNAGTLVLSGNLIPKGATNFDNIITIDFTYSNPVTFESCWCASTQFLGGPVNYNKIQNQCNLDSFLGRPATNADQFFCPTCEANQCQAAAVPGAPDPVFRDWIFFTQVSGTITGPGISLFYQFIINSYGVTADFGVCTPDITNVPLPQLACSNFATPEQGTGWGVNGKNQNCGFSSWFNCAELLPQLGGDNVRVHIADINLDLITCPQPLSPSPTLPIFVPPTVSPTTTPTTTPTKAPTTTPTHPPTRSPTLRPTAAPTTTPSTAPTPAPTTTPTIAPTVSPSTTPTPAPTGSPTEAPTISPSTTPTHAPTSSPTVSPTKAPTTSPTTSPTPAPTTSPTTAPTVSPSTTPTHAPTTSPTVSPTPAPTTSPTTTPTASPTISPTFAPTPCPKPPPCKKIEVCVPCKFFPNDTKCVEDFNVTDFLMGDP